MITQVETAEEYEAALKEIDKLIDSKYGTPECDELERISTMVWQYEKKYAIDPPSRWFRIKDLFFTFLGY